MKPKAIELHIDELVLDGFTGDGRGIGEATERALARLLAERGLPGAFAAGDAHKVLQGGRFDLGARANANSIGSAIAGAVHGAKIRGGTTRIGDEGPARPGTRTVIATWRDAARAWRCAARAR